MAENGVAQVEVVAEAWGRGRFRIYRFSRAVAIPLAFHHLFMPSAQRRRRTEMKSLLKLVATAIALASFVTASKSPDFQKILHFNTGHRVSAPSGLFNLVLQDVHNLKGELKDAEGGDDPDTAPRNSDPTTAPDSPHDQLGAIARLIDEDK